MNALTPLDQALVAWSRMKDPNNNQQQIDDAISLGETGIFSNRNIALITDLEPDFVGSLTGKKDKTGGRFNLEALPFIHDLWQEWARHRKVSPAAVKFVVEMKVSPGMLAKLTGLSRTAIYRWIKIEAAE